MNIIKLRFEFILFIFLEIIAITVTILADKRKSILMYNTISTVSNGLYTFSYTIKNYLYLKTENQNLLENNKKLLNKTLNCQQYNTNLTFDITYAHVLRNSLNRKNNLILLSAGEKQGVRENSGVISTNGNVIGFVIKTTNKFSTALSILNQITSLSVKHKPSNTIGVLSWNGINHRNMDLDEIPGYVQVKIGDTIVTSGFSNIFPEGLIVGYIQSIAKNKHSNNYIIKVRLAEDLLKLNNVYIIHNNSKNELDSLLMEAKKVLGE